MKTQPLTLTSRLEAVSRELSLAVSGRVFAPPVTHVYNPLDYAWSLHAQYLAQAKPHPWALLLGMNPGPWGMAQTGVPFGEIAHVRDFLGIDGNVKQPSDPHPKRPIEGMGCARSEVSGRRVWTWAKETYGTADAFFERFFVWNWCPLAFMEEGGRNHTPDKLPADERASIEGACDDALRAVVRELNPELVIGVGAFARKRAAAALPNVRVEQILHPSPASPAANRGWAPQVLTQLAVIEAAD